MPYSSVLRVRCVCQNELLPVTVRDRHIQRALAPENVHADLWVQFRGMDKSACISKFGVQAMQSKGVAMKNHRSSHQRG
jgi:hypothetical protein